MIVTAVADTHAALWYLTADNRLSTLAKLFMDQAAVRSEKIAVSSITLVEVVYLADKKRLSPSVYLALSSALNDPDHLFTEAFLTGEVAGFVQEVSRNEVPDMPDRIIAATALHLQVPVISRDRRIRTALLETIW